MRKAAFSTTVEEEEKSNHPGWARLHKTGWNEAKRNESKAFSGMRMKWPWTVCLEGSEEGRAGAAWEDVVPRGTARQTLQCLELGSWKGFVPASASPTPAFAIPAALGIWPEDPWPAANLPETMGRVFLGFQVIILWRKTQGWPLGTTCAEREATPLPSHCGTPVIPAGLERPFQFNTTAAVSNRN